MSDMGGPDVSGFEIDDLLGAFVLDAVDADERATIERYLAADPAARAEVDAMRETAASLASLPIDEEGAPAGLWDRIASAIGAPEPVVIDSPRVVPFKSRRHSPVRDRVIMPLAAAAAIVIVVLAVAVASRTPSRAGDLAAAYNHALDHGASAVALQPSLGKGLVSAEIALDSDGTGYLRNEHLAELPAGKTYQLWAIVDVGTKQRAISAGVLGRAPKATAFHVADAPDAFAITVESTPGVIASAHAPVAVGKVSA